eukprot:TRINITY_DN61237_c0_g1_i2.p1 TRINITY_DN61237_c0_g1~~TRINITY_DN61237_c0_g1_i2.p1  ORF type:complete len:179 (+),score=35.32 TRINITY_DN61237_c0_g1_i2:188-724(+)
MCIRDSHTAQEDGQKPDRSLSHNDRSLSRDDSMGASRSTSIDSQGKLVRPSKRPRNAEPALRPQLTQQAASRRGTPEVAVAATVATKPALEIPGALCGDVSLELGALGATFLESVKVATRTHLRRYKMQKADYTKLYKLILKRLDKAYKDRVAPVIRRSTEHIRLCEFIDEQYLLLGL